MDSAPLPSPLPADLTLTLAPSSAACPFTPASPAQHRFRRREDAVFSLAQPPLPPDERGVRLVQLLQACATHTAGGDLARADHCLCLIGALSSSSGDTMQRLATRFAAALAARLLRMRWPGILSALDARHEPTYRPGSVDPTAPPAFARALPYYPFVRAVATATVVGAVARDGDVHVVVLGWQRDPGFLTALLLGFSRLRRGPLRLKLTLVGGDDDGYADYSEGAAALKSAVDVPFWLDTIHVPLRDLDAAVLDEAGAALAVVSILGLHELLRRLDKAAAFLSALRATSPAVVVAVEQETAGKTARAEDRFMEGLHHYGALFDSVDAAATAGRLTAGERAAVEGMLGQEIEEAMAREEREGGCAGAGVLGRAGFRPAGPERSVLEEARQVVEAFRADGAGGYGVAAAQGRAAICWHGRPMYSVSAWRGSGVRDMNANRKR